MAGKLFLCTWSLVCLVPLSPNQQNETLFVLAYSKLSSSISTARRESLQETDLHFVDLRKYHQRGQSSCEARFSSEANLLVERKPHVYLTWEYQLPLPVQHSHSILLGMQYHAWYEDCLGNFLFHIEIVPPKECKNAVGARNSGNGF